MANAAPRILIVEDNPLLAGELADMVRRMGYEVVGPILNLNEALDHARRAEVHFALLDFNLGNGTNATPVARTLAERGVPYAFITGTRPSVVRSAVGEATVLAKPVLPEELLRVLPT